MSWIPLPVECNNHRWYKSNKRVRWTYAHKKVYIHSGKEEIFENRKAAAVAHNLTNECASTRFHSMNCLCSAPRKPRPSKIKSKYTPNGKANGSTTFYRTDSQMPDIFNHVVQNWLLKARIHGSSSTT